MKSTCFFRKRKETCNYGEKKKNEQKEWKRIRETTEIFKCDKL